MLDLPQQENSNRENPMKSFKIEYVDGVLTVLETDGQSRMNEAVHGIHFEHVQGGRPLLKLTIAHDIAPAPAAGSAQEPLVGELVTAQESMNVDNMSFVVPAGTGDAVLRYGCYLDRNGQMVLTILSRFDAFAARNNNVIRGSST